MNASYTKHSLIFTAMLGSTFLGWLAAPVVTVYVLVGPSFASCMASAFVFIAVGNAKACALSVIPLSFVDPVAALLICPAAVLHGSSELTARVTIALGAWLRIWWLGSALPDWSEAKEHRLLLVLAPPQARRQPSTC